MLGLFGPSTEILIEYDGKTSRDTARPQVDIQREGGTEKYYLYTGSDNVVGNITIKCPAGKKVEHMGIRSELIGQIELFYDRGSHYEFTSIVRELSPAGDLTGDKVFPFDFASVEKPYESYNGINVRLRYFVRVTISRQYAANLVKEQDFWVQNAQADPEVNNSFKMEVGIEDCLHIEFEYNKQKYHLKEVVIGKVYFMLVRIKIKHMEIALIKRESTGAGPNLYNESETITKYEIMDGAPVRGESIPIRLFLGCFDLCPSYKNINNKFSLKYLLNLVLVDEDDRRYFKQQEITLYRKESPITQ